MSQPSFAAIAGTTKQTLFSWESGKTAPDASQLAAFAAAGVDVLYVLTGQRDRPMPSVLTPEQERLLARYAAADEAGRKMAHRVLGPDPDQAPVTKVARRGRKAA